MGLDRSPSTAILFGSVLSRVLGHGVRTLMIPCAERRAHYRIDDNHGGRHHLTLLLKAIP